jgi:hypothetical protein
VRRLATEGLENHHFECAGKQIARCGFSHRPIRYRPRVNRYGALCQERNWLKLFEARLRRLPANAGRASFLGAMGICV